MRWVFQPGDALRIIQQLTGYIPSLKDREYVLEIKEHRKQRSLDANAYAWVLINRIAGVMGVNPEEVYRQAIQRCGGTYTVMPVRDDALEEWARIWSGKGIGWQVEIMGPCKRTPGYTNVYRFYGSSVFNTKQMSNLIENLVQDAQALGIDTMTPAERERLVERWGA